MPRLRALRSFCSLLNGSARISVLGIAVAMGVCGPSSCTKRAQLPPESSSGSAPASVQRHVEWQYRGDKITLIFEPGMFGSRDLSDYEIRLSFEKKDGDVWVPVENWAPELEWSLPEKEDTVQNPRLELTEVGAFERLNLVISLDSKEVVNEVFEAGKAPDSSPEK